MGWAEALGTSCHSKLITTAGFGLAFSFILVRLVIYVGQHWIYAVDFDAADFDSDSSSTCTSLYIAGHLKFGPNFVTVVSAVF